MDAPPSGTVTFLFTDIEGSTLLLERLGPAWGATLDAHDNSCAGRSRGLAANR
jgi:class 3 adenylate cyclase